MAMQAQPGERVTSPARIGFSSWDRAGGAVNADTHAQEELCPDESVRNVSSHIDLD